MSALFVDLAYTLSYSYTYVKTLAEPLSKELYGNNVGKRQKKFVHDQRSRANTFL